MSALGCPHPYPGVKVSSSLLSVWRDGNPGPLAVTPFGPYPLYVVYPHPWSNRSLSLSCTGEKKKAVCVCLVVGSLPLRGEAVFLASIRCVHGLENAVCSAYQSLLSMSVAYGLFWVNLEE